MALLYQCSNDHQMALLSNAVMITRWQYCPGEAMITRWYYCISVKWSLDGFTHWLDKENMCLTAKYFGLQEENSNISKPQEKTTIIRKTGCGITERETDGQKVERGRMQCFMEKEDNT